jgi:hypothetical protein
MLNDVAALYIDPRGPYPKIQGVDCWDEARDARLYDGPWPVVAHPPCGPWGRLRHMYRGTEHDCAPRAVEQVRTFGGVLEHPAGSRLWAQCGLPMTGVDAPDFSVEVSQNDWGHPARKRTWLYFVGIDRALVIAGLRSGGMVTHWISGGRGREGKKRNTTPVPPGIKVCSAQQRRRTPTLFADWLVSLARTAVRL